MPDNRDQSRQKRSNENRASRAAVQARKEAVAKKVEPVEDTGGKSKRKTRAQAAPVRGSARTGNAPKATAASSAKPAPAPVSVDPDAPWLRKVLSVPGGRVVLVSLVVSLVVAVVVLVMSFDVPVERWNSVLEGKDIVACAKPDGKKVELNGKDPATVCSYLPDATEKYKDSDSRRLATIHVPLMDVYGPMMLLTAGIPVIVAGVGVALAARPNRRKIFGYCSIMYGVWFMTVGHVFGIYFLVPFGLMVFAWYQARKADPPVRPERGAGGGFGGLFGGRKRGGDDVIDADVVDDGGTAKA